MSHCKLTITSYKRRKCRRGNGLLIKMAIRSLQAHVMVRAKKVKISKFCNNIFPNAVSLNNHERNCKLRPRETETIAEKMILQIQTPVNKDTLSLNNNISYSNNNQNTPDSPKKSKPKANRPPFWSWFKTSIFFNICILSCIVRIIVPNDPQFPRRFT